jgi:hypothetical protein
MNEPATDSDATSRETDQGKPEVTKSKGGPPWPVLRMVIVVAAVLLVAYGISIPSTSLLVVELLLATAALTLGGVAGFLFGIPRATTQQQRDTATTKGETETAAVQVVGGYEPSNNLEQVADWLTKILVGIGLVELRKVRDALATLGDVIAKQFAFPAVDVVSQLVFVSFLAVGFLGSFLWTRIYYGAIQMGADIDVRSLLDRMNKSENKAQNAVKAAELMLNKKVKTPVELGRGAIGEGQAAEVADPKRVAELFPDPEIRRRVETIIAWDPMDWNSDPVGDLFGDAPQVQNGRRLEARIEATLPNALAIRLRVVREGGEPLNSPVAFLLHPTYQQRIEVVTPKDGVAELTIISEGWFTVAAITDNGGTILAYSLKNLSGAPILFRNQ